MNLPNKLTVLRVILVPFFVFFLLNLLLREGYAYDSQGLIYTESYTIDHAGRQSPVQTEAGTSPAPQSNPAA